MVSFRVYPTISNQGIRNIGKRTIPQIEQFFKDNPRRRVCRVEMWYGNVIKFRKNHVKEDMAKAVEEGIKNNTNATD